MALLSEKDRKYVEDEFGGIDRPVKLLMFTQERECQYCRETREIVEELSSLSPNVTSEVYDFVEDAAVAEQYQISSIPAIVVLEDGETPLDRGVRFIGIPSGYEFSSLMDSILMVGRGDSGLSSETRQALAEINEPVSMQVFVTPTCPYCPRAVHLAHQMAFENPYIRAEMVEAIEFPHLANKFNVRGVPRTVINERVHAEGAIPEHLLLHKVFESVGMVHQH